MIEQNIENIDLLNLINSNNNGLNNCLIELTNVCNFKCDHCYVNKKYGSYLPLETLKAILEELKNLNCTKITFTGGETFLYPYFLEIYEYAKNLGFLISLNSNGTGLNEKIIKFLSKSKPCEIEISLYGYDEKTYYEYTHLKNSFNILQKNIKLLKEYKIPFSFKSVVTKKNYHYFYKLKEFAKENNVNFRWDFLVFPVINAKCLGLNPELLEVNDILKLFENDLEIKEYYNEKIKKLEVKNNNKIFQCTGGEEAIFIDSKGFIHMCVSMRNNICKFPEYSIKQSLTYFKNFKDITFNENSKCKNCNKKSICKYCPAYFKMETGDYNIPNIWHCDLANHILNKFTK